MLRVTVELVPLGIEEEKRIIGNILISNIKTYKDNTADYLVEISDEKNPKKTFICKKHDRNKGFWKLIGKILRRKDV